MSQSNLPLERKRQHGTRSRYEAGCRCDPCCEIAAERNKRNRRKAKGLDPVSYTHDDAIDDIIQVLNTGRR